MSKANYGIIHLSAIPDFNDLSNLERQVQSVLVTANGFALRGMTQEIEEWLNAPHPISGTNRMALTIKLMRSNGDDYE